MENKWHHLNKSHSILSRHVRFEENIITLNEIIQEIPSLSLRELAAEVGISRELIYRAHSKGRS